MKSAMVMVLCVSPVTMLFNTVLSRTMFFLLEKMTYIYYACAVHNKIKVNLTNVLVTERRPTIFDKTTTDYYFALLG